MTFQQKFRQSIFFTKELYYKLISRKYFEVVVNFRNFHTVPTTCGVSTLCTTYSIYVKLKLSYLFCVKKILFTIPRSVENRSFFSHNLFAKMLKNFRENNAVKHFVHFVSKMVLKFAQFGVFGTNLRYICRNKGKKIRNQTTKYN